MRREDRGETAGQSGVGCVVVPNSFDPERSWDVLIVDQRDRTVLDPHPLQVELLRRGLRVKVFWGPIHDNLQRVLLRELNDAAYWLLLVPERSADGQKEHTRFEGKSLIDRVPCGRSSAGFDPYIGGQEYGTLEEDGPGLVERLTYWVKAWNR